MFSAYLYRYVDRDRPKTKITTVCVYYLVKSPLLIIIKLKILKENLVSLDALKLYVDRRVLIIFRSTRCEII